MELRIAIIDDESVQRDYIASLVRNWGDAMAHTLQLSLFPSAEAFLFAHGEEDVFDLLLLDIEMGHLSGVELASTLREKNSAVQIVFITGYAEYISAGYDVAALHYLMKPLDPAKFRSVLDRAAERIVQSERTLTVATPDATVRVPLHTIRYIDVLGNYITVHAAEEYRLKRTLSETEALLDTRFYRIGRGLIVNLTYITKVTRTDVCLRGGEMLPIPRGAYEALNRAIINGT